jgi:hypothetical protein
LKGFSHVVQKDGTGLGAARGSPGLGKPAELQVSRRVTDSSAGESDADYPSPAWQ